MSTLSSVFLVTNDKSVERVFGNGSVVFQVLEDATGVRVPVNPPR
jgi:hypothetical protein